ncbi:MAG: M48 family metalloprotease [Acidobacteria bacterium]|nr:M48 family metalloprotease [Acidobacteriota bacterium]
MAENLSNVEICSNGHRQPEAGSRFCIYCGAPILVGQNPQNQAAPQTPNSQAPNQGPVDRNRAQIVPPIKSTQTPAPNYPQQPNARAQHHRQNQQQFNPNPPQQPHRPVVSPQQAYIQPQAPVIGNISACYTCGGNGQKLDPKTVICSECHWLKPLVPGYRVDSSAFEWAADAKAMAALRAMTPLTSAAKMVSEKVGRRWIESTFNGILLGEKQMPQIYAQAVKAARILGMTHMPDIYLSGERPWDCLTFGTEKDSFIIIGSAMAGNFQGPDLFFLLAREMGHCQAGHALWNTVMRFLIGEQGQAKGFMAGGIMNALKGGAGGLVANVVEVPLLAWARQAEITADRAGMICVGNEEIVRRVLISWSLRSSFLFKQVNIEAWLEQQEMSEEEGYSKLSELTTSSTPYLSRRLRLLSEFSKSRELAYWRSLIVETIKRSAPPKKANTAESRADNEVEKKDEKKKVVDYLGIKCAACKTPMKVPLKVLSDKTELPVKCPNEQCGKITRLKKSVKKPKETETAKQKKFEENMNYGD